MTGYPGAARLHAEPEIGCHLFIGIDSADCAFDTMEVEHERCLISDIIKHLCRQPVSKYAREDSADEGVPTPG